MERMEDGDSTEESHDRKENIRAGTGMGTGVGQAVGMDISQVQPWGQ